MSDDEIYKLAMARITHDHDFQMASKLYLASIVLLFLFSASFIAARIFQFRSDSALRRHVGVYDPTWKPPQ